MCESVNGGDPTAFGAAPEALFSYFWRHLADESPLYDSISVNYSGFEV
jgi:hypothetical protein